jgi:hypothetical protein
MEKTFRKSELRKYRNELGKISIFQSYQTRWEETANPEMDDITYHLTLEEAIEINEKISVNTDWNCVVDEIVIDYSELNETVEFGEVFKLSDLVERGGFNLYIHDRDTVYNGDFGLGKSIEGAVIIQWSWEKYIGYARNFHSVRLGKGNEFESDIFSNQDNTRDRFETVLLWSDEIKDLNHDELLNKIIDELDDSNFKWNYFKNRPTDKKVEELVTLW